MVEFWHQLLREFQTPFQDSVLVFSVILFIILLAPVLLKRLRIPGIIGLIISGIIIGPHGLFLIEKNAAVDLFSTIGLLYIMFIAGLELDLGEFKKYRHKSLGFGLLTFLFPIALGFPVCYYLLGYGFNTSLLTASMFATHTLIAYPIVSRLGIAKNEAVAVAVGGTILTDTAVLIILAVIAGVEAEGGVNGLWARLAISILIFSNSRLVFQAPGRRKELPLHLRPFSGFLLRVPRGIIRTRADHRSIRGRSNAQSSDPSYLGAHESP
jgi:Kef-type K+ transport system membrane component KefB